MEIFFNLAREISMATEAMAIEHNWPITRKWTHEELADSIAAIRAIEASKLRVPTAGEIDRVMMEVLGK